jgi:signal transduction histidine kinase
MVACAHIIPAVAQISEIDSLLLKLQSAEKASATADTAYIRLLNQLAYRYDGFKTDSAMFLAEKARSFAEKLGDKRGLARSYINIGNINETRGQYNSALKAHLQGIQIAESIGDKSLTARGCNGLGIVYWDKGEYQSALQSYLKSLRLYEELKDTVNTARAVNNIAIIHQQQNNFKEAMRFYRLSYDIAHKGRDKKSIAVAAGNIGQLFYLEKQYDSTLAYMEESKALALDINDKHTIAARMTDIGEVQQATGKYDEALKNLFAALRIKEEIGESTYIINSLQSIAVTLAAAGRAREGLPYALRAVDSAQALGAKSYLRDALRNLVTVYDSLRMYKEAYQTHRILADVRDSLISSESLQKTLQLQAEFESEKKDKQILLLTKDQELQATTRNMLIALGIALALGIAALYARFRLKVSSERQLQAQNAEILRQQHLLEEQAADIETANTALHEKNIALERQQNILEEQAREIEIANSELQEKNLTLEALNQEKNEFLGIAAHDLKNPLQQIIMASGTIARYYDRMSDNDIQQQVHNMGVVAHRITEIVTNLLDVNAIERGGMTFTSRNFDILPIVQNVIQSYTASAKEKNITLHLHAGRSSNLVFADEQATQQVLDNLISNAVKYSPHGKNIVVRLKSSTEVVRVEIHDEGPGISAEDMRKLFGKFARLSARPTGGEHSTGLGLSIVKKIVEAMNGRVWCESELGKGAMFIVELSCFPASI